MFYTLGDIIDEAEKIFQMADFLGKVTFTCNGDLEGEITVYRSGGYHINLQKPSEEYHINLRRSNEDAEVDKGVIEMCELRDKDNCNTDCEGFDISCEYYSPCKPITKKDVKFPMKKRFTVCPKCGSIVEYNNYYGRYTCTSCNWESKRDEET